MMRMMMRMKRRRRRQTKIKGTNRGNKGQKIIRMWTWIEAQICIWPQISSTIKVRQNTNSSKMPRFCKLPKQPCKITCLWPWHGRGCWAAIAFNAFGGHRTRIPDRWKSCFHRLGAWHFCSPTSSEGSWSENTLGLHRNSDWERWIREV